GRAGFTCPSGRRTESRLRYGPITPSGLSGTLTSLARSSLFVSGCLTQQGGSQWTCFGLPTLSKRENLTSSLGCHFHWGIIRNQGTGESRRASGLQGGQHCLTVR